MENKNNTIHGKKSLYLDEACFDIFKNINPPFQIELKIDEEDADFKIRKIDDRIFLFDHFQELLSLKSNLNNFKYILKSLNSKTYYPTKNYVLEKSRKLFINFQKKLFGQIQISEHREHGVWEDFLKLIFQINNQTHSLSSLIEQLFHIPMLRNFTSIFFFIQLKGESKSNVFGIQWKSEIIQDQIDAKDFNIFFQHIKKAKNKSFTSDTLNLKALPLCGHFLAQEVTYQKFNLIISASRNDFLPCLQDEIDIFRICINLLQPHILNLLEKEFSNNQISELKNCILNFPTPIKIEDLKSSSYFTNDFFQNSLLEKDIFLTEIKNDIFKIHFYDSSNLQDYAFDIFHFQRLSLLGELLNTLRHELSNPLFGLKLGTELLIESSSSKIDLNISKEIHKNILRCQSIIENFSSLYQANQVQAPLQIERIINETITICKSEIRDIKITILLAEVTKKVIIHQPLLSILQIIFNLIINATHSIKKSNSKGLIHISSDLKSNFVFIKIQDNGIGISSNEKSMLFKPFYTTKEHGTGLGLILSRNLAIQMGGDLECSEVSNEFGGATFLLKIPLNEKNSNY